MNKKILIPYITEKTLKDAEKGIYWFLVDKTAKKPAIKNELKAEYKVDAIKINIVNIPKQKIKKRLGRRIRYKIKGGIKKARVVLKKGQKIEEFKK